MSKPKIIVICGSTRFIDVMSVTAWLLERDELAIVMGLHLLPYWYGPELPADHLAEHEGVADNMDDLHLRKIDLADEVYVVNRHYYIGDSTRNEVEYAESKGLPIRWHTNDPIGNLVEMLIKRFLESECSGDNPLLKECNRLLRWVDDLQSGMTVNCVYCGHSYGPKADTPVSMAVVLREHIEQCPEHPLANAMAFIRDIALAECEMEGDHEPCQGCPSCRARAFITNPPARTENTCRDCGCTDTNACKGSCWWVEEDLCSSCAKPDDAPSGEAA